MEQWAISSLLRVRYSYFDIFADMTYSRVCCLVPLPFLVTHQFVVRCCSIHAHCASWFELLYLNCIERSLCLHICSSYTYECTSTNKATNGGDNRTDNDRPTNQTNKQKTHRKDQFNICTHSYMAFTEHPTRQLTKLSSQPTDMLPPIL